MAFERFEVWRVAHELALSVYRLSSSWPTHERYGLVSQARRASVSIASNIAEGAAKRGRREFGRHLDVALGSYAELTYLLHLAKDLSYYTQQEHAAIDPLCARTGRLLWGLYWRVRPRPDSVSQNCV